VKIRFLQTSVQAVQLWAASTLLLVASAWVQLPLDAFLLSGLLYPAIVGTVVGLFAYLWRPEELVDGDVPQRMAVVLILTPVVLTLWACAVLLLGGRFEEVAWVLMCVAAATGQQAGQLARLRRGDDGDDA
jgi:hypothetical protein